MTKSKDKEDFYDIRMEHVTFTYADAKEPALVDVSLKIKRGETVGIIGPNGAGKTTLCRTFNGLVPHFFIGKFKGNVMIQGINSRKATIGQLSQVVGLVFDDPITQLVCATVIDELAFGPENLGIPPSEIERRIEETVKVIRLKGYQERAPFTLSGGEQQSLAIGAILTMRPNILVMDEPTSNLDPLGTELVFQVIRNLAETKNKTLVVTSHKIDKLVNFDRIVILNGGNIVLNGKPRDVLKNVEFLRELGLEPPHVTTLAYELQKRKKLIDEKIPLTLEDAHKSLVRILNKKIHPLKEFRLPSMRRTEGKPIVEVEDLWHIYPPNVEALKGVNLKINPREFIAIIGQNGSGKTTLVKHFNGLLKPSKGRLLIFGEDTRQYTVTELSTKVGYVFQNPDLQLFSITVKKEIAFGLKALRFPAEEIERRVKEVAEMLNLGNVLDVSPGSLDKGARQRVAIAAVLAMGPEVLVVDEPTTGQDPSSARTIMDLMKKLNEIGKTIVVITHNMGLVAEYAERAVVMHKGKILYDGTTRDVFSKPEILTKSYLMPPQITRLGQMLRDFGIPSDVLTVKEMYRILVG